MDSKSTDALQVGEDLAARGAVAPRVSYDDLKNAVAREHYFTAGAAAAALGQPSCTDDPLDLLMICILVLHNGWTLIGKSAPASADNFDAEKGKTFAKEDALRQLWPLMGFALRDSLHQHQEMLSNRVIQVTAPDMRSFIGTKAINAKPMNRADYVTLRGWEMPTDENPADEGYLVEYTDKADGNVPGFQGYVTWSPKDVFERAYHAA